MKKYVFALTFLVVFAGQSQEVSKELKQEVEKASILLESFQPTEIDPVSLNAVLVWSEDKTQLAVVMKANVLDE